MPYRFDVTEGEKKVFGCVCGWAEIHLPVIAADRTRECPQIADINL